MLVITDYVHILTRVFYIYVMSRMLKIRNMLSIDVNKEQFIILESNALKYLLFCKLTCT